MNLKSEARSLVLLALITFVVFANSLGGDFVYDDSRQILRNPLIQDSTLIGKALTSDVWAFKGDGSVAASNYYRPTFVAWMILNFRLFANQSFGWHLFNLLLHIVVCLLAFLLLRRWKLTSGAAFAVALVFAVHPVHTESVGWISGAPDLLFAALMLGAIWFAENVSPAYSPTDETEPVPRSIGRVNLMLALVFFLLALGSKEVGILCFPLFFLIFRKNLGSARAVKITLPFAALAALYFAARWMVIGAISLPPEDGVGFYQTILTMPAMFVFYLRQMIFPVWLSANHPLRPVDGINLLGFLLPLLISLAAAALFFLAAKKSFVPQFGFCLFILTLLPALNTTVFPAEQIVHDRYLYLPLLGFLMMIFPYIFQLVEKIAQDKSEVAVIFLAALIAFPLALKTFSYNQIWKNDLALWSQAVTIDQNSAFTWAQYAAILSEKGRITEAIEAYNNSLNVRPTAPAYYGKARNLMAANKPEEAIFDLQTVIDMPNERLNAYTLYQAYELLALALAQQKRYPEAQKYLLAARQRLPIYSAALTEKLAVVFYQAGDKAAALRELEGAKNKARTEFLPESKTVFLRLAMLYAETGKKQEAKTVLQEYLNLTADLRDNVSMSDRQQAANLLRQLN